MKTEPNDPVHPNGVVISRLGITKREYFAAMAMQGLLANTNNSRNPIHAEDAVILSDALLSELNKSETI